MKVMACKVIALGFVLIFGLPGVSQTQKLVIGYSAHHRYTDPLLDRKGRRLL
jgi:hypothetical protein